MNSYYVRDRLKAVFSILSDGHFQCTSRALCTSTLLEKGMVRLSRSSLSKVRGDLKAQVIRLNYAIDEFETLIEAIQ